MVKLPKEVMERIEEIKKIKWFKQVSKEDLGDVQRQVDKVCDAFKIKRVKVEIQILYSEKEWDAAYGAARDAAWDAAYGAAWDAAWLIVADKMREKGWKGNPFREIMVLWEQGFYVCGVVKGKFLLYRMPTEDEMMLWRI